MAAQDNKPGLGLRERSVVDRSRSYKTNDQGIAEIYDLDFAAFLLMHNVALAESYRDGREFMFKFLDTNDSIKNLAITYANSESAKFADCVRRLKKVTIAQSISSR